MDHVGAAQGAGQHQIANQQGNIRRGLQQLQRLFTAGGFQRQPAQLIQLFTYRLADILFIFQHQRQPLARRGRSSTAGATSFSTSVNARGSCSRTVVPCPGALSSATRPPDWRTKPYTIDSPRPLPLPVALVVKKGSNTRAFTACDIPLP